MSDNAQSRKRKVPPRVFRVLLSRTDMTAEAKLFWTYLYYQATQAKGADDWLGSYSQREVADAVGLTLNTVRKYERLDGLPNIPCPALPSTGGYIASTWEHLGDTSLSANARLLHVWLESWAELVEMKGWLRSEPSHARMAEGIGVTERTVRRAMAELVRAERWHRKRRPGQRSLIREGWKPPFIVEYTPEAFAHPSRSKDAQIVPGSDANVSGVMRRSVRSGGANASYDLLLEDLKQSERSASNARAREDGFSTPICQEQEQDVPDPLVASLASTVATASAPPSPPNPDARLDPDARFVRSRMGRALWDAEGRIAYCSLTARQQAEVTGWARDNGVEILQSGGSLLLRRLQNLAGVVAPDAIRHDETVHECQPAPASSPSIPSPQPARRLA